MDGSEEILKALSALLKEEKFNACYVPNAHIDLGVKRYNKKYNRVDVYSNDYNNDILCRIYIKNEHIHFCGTIHPPDPLPLFDPSFRLENVIDHIKHKLVLIQKILSRGSHN